MSQIILNILCEGQTEERFAKNILKTYLQESGIVVKTQLLLTNKKKNIRGGMISYERVKMDINLWIKQHAHKTYEVHYFTTMFDLYKLPDDFPGYEDAQKSNDCYAAVKALEDAFALDIKHCRFIPYIQLHEFEALVFCGLDHLLDSYPDMGKEVESLKQILNDHNGNPEKINSSPETAPSKRIIKTFVAKHNYDKPKLGEYVTGKVGITGIMAKCNHFKQWVEELQKITAI